MIPPEQIAAQHSNDISRRQFWAAAGGVLATCVGAGCSMKNDDGRSTAGVVITPLASTSTTASAGTHALELGQTRDAVVHVPVIVDERPMPLVVLFHGAGGSGAGILRHLASAAESLRVAILAPDSRGRTWDALNPGYSSFLDRVSGWSAVLGFGPDVVFLERALERVFRMVAVDPARVSACGFSDGATYALSLGLRNGDLFRRVVAFSPGFVVEGEARGRPEIFVSHGRRDDILPIERCSRRIVPQLQRRGYVITYREFDGGHEIPATIASEGLQWAAGLAVPSP
jgi:predicted esterase